MRETMRETSTDFSPEAGAAPPSVTQQSFSFNAFILQN